MKVFFHEKKEKNSFLGKKIDLQLRLNIKKPPEFENLKKTYIFYFFFHQRIISEANCPNTICQQYVY
jgi:hypothetical protein